MIVFAVILFLCWLFFRKCARLAAIRAKDIFATPSAHDRQTYALAALVYAAVSLVLFCAWTSILLIVAWKCLP